MADNIDSPRMSAGPESEPVFHSPTSPATSHVGHAKAPGPVGKSLGTVMLPGAIVIAALAGISVWVGKMEAPAPKPGPPPASAAATAPAPAPATPAAPATIDLLSTEVKEVKSQLDGLASQLKGVQGKVDSLPKPAPPPDLKPIQGMLDDLRGKTDDLAKSISGLLPLTDNVSKLQTQVSGVDTAMKGFRDKVAGISAELQKISAAKPVAVGEKPKPAPVASAPSLVEGVELFKAGRYQEAGEVFKKIESSSPSAV